MKKLLQPLLIFCLLFSFASHAALNLQQAKQQGLVGETTTGYLAAVKSSAAVNALVKQVNDKRRQLYQQMANKNQLSLTQVEQLAGRKAIAKTAAGHYIQTDSGQWQKK